MAFRIELFFVRLVEVLFFIGLGGCAIVVALSWISIFKSGFSDAEESNGSERVGVRSDRGTQSRKDSFRAQQPI